jgi:hypothetical protein
MEGPYDRQTYQEVWTVFAGHEVHWIQARKGAEDMVDRPAPGHLLEVGSDGVVVVEVGGEIRRLWHHDFDRLERLVADDDLEIGHQPTWGLLWSHNNGLLCVVDADSPSRGPCPTARPAADPVDLLLEAGGFSISGPEALRLLRPPEERSNSERP